MQLKTLLLVWKFHLVIQQPRHNFHSQQHSGGLNCKETEITVSIQVDPQICERGKKPIYHDEQNSLTQKKKKTHRRRIILRALSWASLFEDNPLFDCCCLITSSSTFQKHPNKLQVIQCSNPTKFRYLEDMYIDKDKLINMLLLQIIEGLDSYSRVIEKRQKMKSLTKTEKCKNSTSIKPAQSVYPYRIG